MDDAQREKLLALLRDQQVLILATLGEEWPTTTFQAFAETEDLQVVLIMRENTERFSNIARDPRVTVHVDTRDKGIAGLAVTRASVRGLARVVEKESEEWARLKGVFLAKNAFEEPFFGNELIRMVVIEPRSVSYANGLADRFVATF